MVYQHHHCSHSNPQKNLATVPDLREAAGTFSFCDLGQGSAMVGCLASGVLLKNCVKEWEEERNPPLAQADYLVD